MEPNVVSMLCTDIWQDREGTGSLCILIVLRLEPRADLLSPVKNEVFLAILKTEEPFRG